MPYIIERINALEHTPEPLTPPRCPDCGSECVFGVGPRVEPQPMQRVGVVYYLSVRCVICAYAESGKTARVLNEQPATGLTFRDDTWATEREQRDALGFEPNRFNWLGRESD